MAEQAPRSIRARARAVVTGHAEEREALAAEAAALRTRLEQTRTRLEQTRTSLESTRAALEAAKAGHATEIRQHRKTKRDLEAARLERDERRATPEVEAQIAAVREQNLTFLRPPQLRDLALALLDIERAGLPGMVIEAGTALGGSAIVLATAKSAERPMAVYDVFGLIPEPGERDGEDVHRRYEEITSGSAVGHAEGETYYGYREDLLGEVSASFDRLGVATHTHNVELVPGLFQDTIHVDGPVALANLDGDWYESTKVCLERIAPHVVSGGRIVLDDYDQWSGCRDAVDEYFADRGGQWRFERRHRLHVVRL